MPTAAAVAYGALPPTLSATVDLTAAGFGEPTAAIVFTCNDDPVGGSGWNGGGILSIGLWAANAQAVLGYGLVSAGGSSATARGGATGVCARLQIYNNSASYLTASAAAISGGNGLRFTVTEDNVTVDKTVCALMLKGTTNAYVGTVNLGTGTTEITVNDAGFQPDVLIFVYDGAPISAYSSNADLSFGVAHRNSAGIVSQGAQIYSSTHNTGNTTMCLAVISDAAVAKAYPDSITMRAPVTSWNSTGFGITPSVSSGGSDLIYLALKLADPDDFLLRFVKTVDDKSASLADYTEIGFKPDALCFCQTLVPQTPTPTSIYSHYYGFGLCDATTECAVGTWETDGAAYTYAFSLVDTGNCISIPNTNAPTFDTNASFDSFHLDGFRLNYSDRSAVPRVMMMLAFGDSTAAGSGEIKPTRTLSSPTYAPGSISNTGVTPRVTQTNTAGT